MYQGGSSASAPSGTGFVRATGGAFVDPAEPLSAADIRNAIWCGTSTGSANSPTLTTPTALTLATGVALLFKLNATVTAGNVLVTVNGTTKYLYSSPSGDGWLGGELVAGEIYLMVFDGALNGGAGAWRIISRYRLTPGDMPELGSTRCSLNTDQTGISGDSTFHTITFNSVDFNTGSNFSWSGGVATCLVAGRYAAASQLFLSTGGYHAIRHNSAQKAAIFSAEVWTQCFLPPVDLQVGDTIDCRVRTASTATAYYTDVGAVGSLASWLAIWRVK